MSVKQAVRTARKQAVKPATVRHAEAVRPRPRTQEAEETASNHLLLALQAKLRIAPPGDPRELEADRVAASITRAPRAVHRKCACGGGCDECRQSGPAVQRQAKSDVRRVSVPPMVERVVASSGQALDPATRAFMEPRFGRDFSDVRIHYDNHAAASARAIEARAYTVGSHIAFDRGEYAPASDSGRRLLAHELTHVVQQNGVADGSAWRDEAAKKIDIGVGLKHPDAFWEWWKKVAGFEGSLTAWKANKANVNDAGGPTNWGVTQGTFSQYHNVIPLPDTPEDFAAMTPEQAAQIGRTFWKQSHADELANPGVAIIVCDWYWGSTTFAFIEIKKRLSQMGKYIDKDKKFLIAGKYHFDDLDPDTIAVMNSMPPGELSKQLTEQRLDHYARIAADPKAKNQAFGKGWEKRATERGEQAQEYKDQAPVADPHVDASQAFRGAMAKGTLDKAVEAIRDFSEKDTEHEFKLLSRKDIVDLNEKAVQSGLAADSTLVSVSRYRRLVYRYEQNVESQNWVDAAFYLNYFSEADIKEFVAPLRKKHADQLKLLHEAAVQTRGAGSYAAQFTAP